MSEEVTLAMAIAKWIAVWHLVIAGYLVFVSERNSPALMTIALLKALLGGCIYLIVLEPEWAFLPDLGGFLLPFTLVLLGLISLSITWLIWRLYDLDAPHIRVQKLILGWLFRTRNNCQKRSDGDE